MTWTAVLQKWRHGGWERGRRLGVLVVETAGVEVRRTARQ